MAAASCHFGWGTPKMSSVRAVVFTVAVGTTGVALGFPFSGPGAAERAGVLAVAIVAEADWFGTTALDVWAAVALETLTSGPGPWGDVLAVSAAIAVLAPATTSTAGLGLGLSPMAATAPTTPEAKPAAQRSFGTPFRCNFISAEIPSCVAISFLGVVPGGAVVACATTVCAPRSSISRDGGADSWQSRSAS